MGDCGALFGCQPRFIFGWHGGGIDLFADIFEQSEVSIFRNSTDLIDSNAGRHFVGVMAASASFGEQGADFGFEHRDAVGSISGVLKGDSGILSDGRGLEQDWQQYKEPRNELGVAAW